MINKHNQIRKLRCLAKRLSRRNQHGSSLLEVLVAVFIMAIGLLGLAALQANNLKNINNSQFRTLATSYAYDMAERMRSNRTAALAGEYTDCTSDDCLNWKGQISQPVISGGLPTGTGTVTKRSGNVYDIKIAWQELQRDSAGEKVEFTLSIQL